MKKDEVNKILVAVGDAFTPRSSKSIFFGFRIPCICIIIKVCEIEKKVLMFTPTLFVAWYVDFESLDFNYYRKKHLLIEKSYACFYYTKTRKKT